MSVAVVGGTSTTNWALEAELGVDASEHGRELARVSDERFAAHYCPQRTWAALAAFCGLCAVFWLISLIPAVRTRLHVQPGPMAGLMLLEALAITAATVSARYFGGVHGRAHRVSERIETLVTAGVLSALIYGSGGAVSIFWLLTVLHLSHSAPDASSARFVRLCHAACLALVALAFTVDAKLADAVIVSFFCALVQLLSWAQAKSAQGFLAAQAERNVLRRRLEQVLVERERQRIARDLHDGLGGQLAALAWAAEALLAEQPHAQGELKSIAERARGGLHELRWLMSDLERASMSLEQLAQSLRSGGARIAPSHTHYTVEHHGEVTLSPELCYQLSLMVREATVNAFRHAEATRVTVTLRHEATLTVQVSDDGKGLILSALERSSGGLAHLRQRAQQLGGELLVESSERGTTVTFHVTRL